MKKSVRKILFTCLALPLGLFVYVTVALVIVHRVHGVDFAYEHNGTDLTFASSDGGWRGEEDMIKGRDFAGLLVEFELYKIRRERPGITLLRTKPWKRPYKWAWWFDRRSSLKWRVPYVPPAEVPTVASPESHGGDVTSAERALARERAAAYLEQLGARPVPVAGP